MLLDSQDRLQDRGSAYSRAPNIFTGSDSVTVRARSTDDSDPTANHRAQHPAGSRAAR